MLEMYARVIEAAKEHLDSRKPSEAAEEEDNARLEEIGLEKVRQYVEGICAACGAFDGDAAAEICNEACGCSVKGVSLKPLFGEVKAAAEDFEYDQAAELARKIPEKIGGV